MATVTDPSKQSYDTPNTTVVPSPGDLGLDSHHLLSKQDQLLYIMISALWHARSWPSEV